MSVFLIMMTSSNGNIFRVTGSLYGNSPVNSPHKCQWRGALIFLWTAPEQRLSKQSRRRWFKTPSRSSWRHCSVLNFSELLKQYHVHILQVLSQLQLRALNGWQIWNHANIFINSTDHSVVKVIWVISVSPGEWHVISRRHQFRNT